MKLYFLEARWKGKLKLKRFESLPKKLGLCSSVQFLDVLPAVKSQLEATGRKVSLIKATHASHKGQILGCSKFKLEAPAVLYIGDGSFHPNNIKLNFPGRVFSYNPFTDKLTETKKVSRFQKRQQGMLAKFYDSETIGVLITTKPGQNWRLYEKLEQKFPNKKFYYLIFNDISFSEFLNFPFVELWLNTACPRIGIEDAFVHKLPLLNIDQLDLD